MADKMFKALAKEMMSTSRLSQELDPWGTVCCKSPNFHPLCCDACFVYFNYVFVFGGGCDFASDCSPGFIPLGCFSFHGESTHISVKACQVSGGCFPNKGTC